ncbi:MAG TPA: universal stress protein [Mycobacteriales bacterium]|nr:universal stress protein [Mycobacteriales bacterium]
MTDRPRGLGVLVGVDGSDHSLAAARWGAGEAVARRVPLTLCRVVPGVADGAEFDRQSDAVRHDLDRAVRQPELAAGGTELKRLVVAGTASRELVALGRDADLLVVGARGRGGFAGLLLGSVGDQVATHAPGSVVVVREHLERPAAPVFLGVDDAPGTSVAVGYAFDLAGRDDRALVAVYSYPPPVALPDLGYLPVSTQTHAEDRARSFVDGVLMPWRDKYPEVTVDVQVTARRPAVALCEASVDAHLLVVGATGRPAFAGLLGGVTRKALHHARCPVVVAR